MDQQNNLRMPQKSRRKSKEFLIFMQKIINLILKNFAENILAYKLHSSPYWLEKLSGHFEVERGQNFKIVKMN